MELKRVTEATTSHGRDDRCGFDGVSKDEDIEISPSYALPRNSLETSSVISLPISIDSQATVPEDTPPTESQDIGWVVADALSQSEVDFDTSPTESQDKDALSKQSEPATTASRKRVRYTSLEAEPEAKQRKTDSTESAADALFRELEIQSYQSYQEWK